MRLVAMTAEDLRVDLQRLAADQGYVSPEALGEAIASGEVGAQTWVAWEYRSLRRMLAAECERAVAARS